MLANLLGGYQLSPRGRHMAPGPPSHRVWPAATV